MFKKFYIFLRFRNLPPFYMMLMRAGGKSKCCKYVHNFANFPTLFTGTADLAIGSLRKWRNRFCLNIIQTVFRFC